MKIRVGKRYLNGQGKVIYINYADKECFYGVADGVHGQLAYYKDGRRAGTLTDQSDLRLVAPYKPKRRKPTVGDHVDVRYIGMIKYVSEDEEGQSFHVDFNTHDDWVEPSQIVRILNKESGK
ncbi:MAG: hypothetical protein BWZ03_00069 [bacterium ADurb.BinA186]|nr:MAG: hypothetical protein BWZ03_00069 [bacterium ADurb.BinA186]